VATMIQLVIIVLTVKTDLFFNVIKQYGRYMLLHFYNS
jgi:hypothetical protein